MPTEPPLTDARYWRHVTDNARAIHTDGCTLVKDFYVMACWEHDLHYRTGRNWLGEEVGYFWTNRRLGTAIRYFSILRGWSILAVTRFLGTMAGGWIAWIRYRRKGRSNWPLVPDVEPPNGVSIEAHVPSAESFTPSGTPPTVGTGTKE